MAPKDGSVVGLCHLSLILCEISYIDHYFCTHNPTRQPPEGISDCLVWVGHVVSDFLLGGVFVLDSPLFFIGGVGGVCHPHRLMSDVVGLLVYRTADGGAVGFFPGTGDKCWWIYGKKSVGVCDIQCNALTLVLAYRYQIKIMFSN